MLHHLLLHLNQVLHVSGAVEQKLLNDGPFFEVLPALLSEHSFHFLLVLVGAVGRTPLLQNLVQPRSLRIVYMFDGMLIGDVPFVHKLVEMPLLKVDLCARRIKHILGGDLHAAVQSHDILLAGVHNLEFALVLEDATEGDCYLVVEELVVSLDLEDVDYEDVLFCGYAAHLNEVYVASHCQTALEVHS